MYREDTSSGSTFADRPADRRDNGGSPRERYREILCKRPDDAARQAAKAYLQDCLRAVADAPADLPADWRGLQTWMQEGAERTGRAYRDYLASRQSGAPRRYFSSRAHALYFLRSVAPTKLVDGAWLYGTLAHWDDPRFFPLIRTYLEELGEGVPGKNHVVLYRRLLATHACDQWDDLGEEHFVQGAIQLALSQHAAEFLPELIGFNLGYEQLPLHLPITAYELNELGIDPYYFTLHVTVDNAGSGHARKAIEAFHAAMPVVGDSRAFYRRVLDGYRLNGLGLGTEAAIASFDLDREVIGIFQRKSVFGKNVHSDYCRVAGRSVSSWLAQPSQIPAFLAALEAAGWIKRHQDPGNSRFWKLLEGERAEMFGVFTQYELQLIHDWIAGDAITGPEWSSGADAAGGVSRGRLTFRARRRLLTDLEPHGEAASEQAADEAAALRRGGGDFDADARLLEARLGALHQRHEKMDFLVPLLSPALHSTKEGLLATRLFNEGLMASY